MSQSAARSWEAEPDQLWRQLDELEGLLDRGEPSEVVLPAFDRLVHAFDAFVRECAPRDADRLGRRLMTELVPSMQLAASAGINLFAECIRRPALMVSASWAGASSSCRPC